MAALSMAARTNFSQNNASNRLELERIINMKKPHKAMKTRNSEKGLLAIWRFPLTIRTTSKATQNVNSIKGVSKYVFKFGFLNPYSSHG